MWVFYQEDDPFVCFGAKPNKGLISRSSTRPKVGKGTPEKELEKGRQKWVGEGRRRRAVDNGQQKRPVGWDRVVGQWGRQARWVRCPESTTVSSEEDGHRWVFIPRSFVEIWRKIHVSVSLQMHRECSVTEPPFLHFELTQAPIVRLFFVLFLPLPRLYFLRP